MSAGQVTEPLAADPRLRTLLDRVQAAYGEITGHLRPAGNPAVSAPVDVRPDFAAGVQGVSVPADLRARLVQARDEALQLRPTIERLTAVYAEAETIAINAPRLADDAADEAALERFFWDSGAEALGRAIGQLADAMVTANGTWLAQ